MKVYGGPDDGFEANKVPEHGETCFFTAPRSLELDSVVLVDPIQRAAIYVEHDGNLYFDRMETIDLRERAGIPNHYTY